ncbi:hypothetical protein CLU82_2790 [Flavobacterium sp. 5]|nr:hypothetical protein CLU82_2790 [Flavobacterium sp. 5]
MYYVLHFTILRQLLYEFQITISQLSNLVSFIPKNLKNIMHAYYFILLYLQSKI